MKFLSKRQDQKLKNVDGRHYFETDARLFHPVAWNLKGCLSKSATMIAASLGQYSQQEPKYVEANLARWISCLPKS